MSSRRSLSWNAALRDLKDDRLTRPEIREERLRTARGLRGSSSIALSAWRGLSGTRYVVSVRSLSTACLNEVGEVVVIVVRRPAAGPAVIVDIAQSVAIHEPGYFIGRAEALGANELHIFSLGVVAAERAAMIADLTAPSAALAKAA